MWAEDEGGIKDDLRKGEFVPSVHISSASNRRRTKGVLGGRERAQNLHIFYPKKLLCELACEFY
jgi:hypothetical protein